MMTDGDEHNTKSGTSHTQEDPLVLAVEDLMGRVITSIDAVKTLLPTGLSASDLAAQLRPIIEVVAHTAPSVTRTYFSTDMDTTLDQLYGSFHGQKYGCIGFILYLFQGMSNIWELA